MTQDPNNSMPEDLPESDFQNRDRWSEIRASRDKRAELSAELDQLALQTLLAKQTQRRAHLQPKKLQNTPRYKAWTKHRRAHAMPGMEIKIELNPHCLGNTKSIQRAWAPLAAGPWIVVRHTDQRLLCRHPSGNEIWVNKECGHTTKYVWDIMQV